MGFCVCVCVCVCFAHRTGQGKVSLPISSRRNVNHPQTADKGSKPRANSHRPLCVYPDYSTLSADTLTFTHTHTHTHTYTHTYTIAYMIYVCFTHTQPHT